jgi:hypothetical protein
MEISLNNQQIELLQTLLEPLVKDNDNSNYTRTVALAILTKITNGIHNK